MAIERGWERSGKTANQISKNFYGMTIMGFQHTLGNKKSQIFWNCLQICENYV